VAGKHKRKKALILDREPFRYREFLSDIAGHEICCHDSRWNVAIARVRDWLEGIHTEDRLPGPRHLIESFHLFQVDLPRLAAAADCEPDTLSFQDLCRFIREWVREMERAETTRPAKDLGTVVVKAR
jgi:hypothetical protein